VKRYRLGELPDVGEDHVFRGIVSSPYIWQEAAIEFRKPGEVVPWGVQGKARVRLDAGVEHLRAGDVVLIEPGERHQFESDEEEPCVQMYVHCGPERHPNQASYGASGVS